MAAAGDGGGGGPEEGVGESSTPPRDPVPAPTPAASGGSSGGGRGAGGGLRDICREVFERLISDGHAAGSDLRAQHEAHFNRLPMSYKLDVNIDKAEDVLFHQKVLAEAKDPDRRPAFAVRFLRVTIFSSCVTFPMSWVLFTLSKDRERERSASRHGHRYDAASSTRERHTASSGIYKASGDAPAAAPEPRPERRRSRERNSSRRAGHVQRSPRRATAHEQNRDSSPATLDSPANARCTSISITHDGGDRSPSPSPQASHEQAAPAMFTADPFVHCRAPDQDVNKEATHPCSARFKPGCIITRRPRNNTMQAPTSPFIHPAANRFKLGLHYTRRPRGPGGTRARRPCAAQASAAPCDVEGETKAEAFLSSITRPTPPALLHLPAAEVDARRRRRKTSPANCGARRSVRIAKRTWPRGSTEDCARQIIMKRLGVLEEEDDKVTDDLFLHYVQLFQGQLDDKAIAALTALCGLEAATA